MDFNLLIDRKRQRFAELEREIADPDLFANRKRAGETMREHSNTKQLIAQWDQLVNARKHLEDARELLASTDEDLAQMAQEEGSKLEKQVDELECDVQIALMPEDKREERDAIIEIRGRTGWYEAGIFVAGLYRMYNRYAQLTGLKIKVLESSPTELGGLKEVIFK